MDVKINVYLFEVQYLKPMIKEVKDRIKQLRFRKQRTVGMIEKLEYEIMMMYNQLEFTIKAIEKTY